MPVTVTCPSCSQVCQVEDQHAGMDVRCPKCAGTIQVPRPAVSAVAAIPIPPAVPVIPAAPAAGAPPGPMGPGFMETIQQSAAAFGLDDLSLKLLYAGLGCLAGMVLFTFFPWLSVSLPGAMMHISALGINTTYGVLNFLLSSGAIALLAIVFLVLKKKDTFDMVLWGEGVWSVLAVLGCLIHVIRYSNALGIGLILTLLASLGAAGCFGFIIFQRFIKKKTQL